MSQFMFNLVSGVLSGLVASVVFTYWQEWRASRRGDATVPLVTGDGNNVHIDRRSSRTVLIRPAARPAADNGPRRADGLDDDPWGVLAVTAAAAVAVTLGTLLIWPYLLGLNIGVVASILLVTWRLNRSTPTQLVLRARQATWASVAVGVLSGAVWGCILFIEQGDLSLPRLADELTRAYPEYGSGVKGRWSVLTRHTGDVLELIGLPGVSIVVYDVLAMFAVALLLALQVMQLAEWGVANAVARGATSPWALAWALRFRERGWAFLSGMATMGVLALALVALPISSG